MHLPGAVLFAAMAAAGAGASPPPSPTPQPGRQPGGETLLPNGWRIAPAGRHLTMGDMPLALVQSPDGRHVIVSNNGYDRPTLSVVDLQAGYVRHTVSVDDAWLGLAVAAAFLAAAVRLRRYRDPI